MRCSGCWWSCQEGNVPPFTRDAGSWDSPRLHLHGGVDQEQQVMAITWTESYCATAALPAGCTSSEPEPVWPGTCSWREFWVLADLILVVSSYKEPGRAGMGKELTLGWNTSFSDVFPLHRCPIPGTSNYGRQVFLLLHTSETWLPAVQLFPADSSFRDFYQNQENQLGSCPGYRLHWARILLLPSKNYFYKKK